MQAKGLGFDEASDLVSTHMLELSAAARAGGVSPGLLIALILRFAGLLVAIGVKPASQAEFLQASRGLVADAVEEAREHPRLLTVLSREIHRATNKGTMQ